MNLFDNITNLISENVTGNKKAAFMASLIAGFLAHGYGMANNYIYHDATILNGLGITFGIGRWALGFSGMLNELFLGNYNLPFINVVISLLFIALSAMNVVELFEIKNKYTSIVTGALMAVYPVVTSSFAYNFTASYYFFALYLVTVAVKLMKNCGDSYIGISEDGYSKNSLGIKAYIKPVVGAAIILAFSAGFYQAYLSVAATLLVALLIIELYRKDESFLISISKGCLYVGALIAGLLCYMVFNRIAVMATNEQMVAYQGADDFGKLEIAKIPGRIIQSYLHFFYIKWNGINTSKGMWALVILILLTAVVAAVKNIIKKSCPVINKVLLVVLTALFPMAVNLCYLMSTSDNYSVHTLMRYATLFVILVPIVLIEEDRGILTNIAEVLTFCIIVCYIFANNAAYVKMNLVQEEMTSYFTVLQSRITSLDGYKDDMPVVFVGEFAKEDPNLTKLSETYPEIQFLGYEYNAQDLINKESWLRYMKIHTGFEPVTGELTGDIIESEDYQSMNCYPDYDSVKSINGRIVVKFSE